MDNRTTTLPSLSCRWVLQLTRNTYRNERCLYLSEQTDGRILNTLVIVNYNIEKSRDAAAEHVTRVSCSATLRKDKIIIHPGEILAGHQENAVSALAMCPTEPFILSGGRTSLWSCGVSRTM